MTLAVRIERGEREPIVLGADRRAGGPCRLSGQQVIFGIRPKP